MTFKIVEVGTTPFDDQKPGTSGLRKPTKTFIDKENYTANFIQSIFDTIEEKRLIVVGGDGRHYMKEATDLITKIAAANGVKKLIIGRDCIFSTPAVSAIIREMKASGGIILTASHNPGGPEGDFGIKFNGKNGGPAPESVTDKFFEASKTIDSFSYCPELNCDFSRTGTRIYQLENDETFSIEVVDSIDVYLRLMKRVFDFPKIKNLLSCGTFRVLIDSMNGVMGPYCKRVFVTEFGLTEESLQNCVPLPDFGGKHPDPNLIYATDLVSKMKTGKYDFGAAFDGDGDRNMILGKNGFFVTPSDSLAIIAANLDLIPYFKKKGIPGFARSMPTAPALDQVASRLGLPVIEVPTGWKFFGNLLDEGLACLCGEESFGIGSDHIREKDGLWAALCWLTILGERSPTGEVSIQQVIEDHWKDYGRNYFARYDYENCPFEDCNQMMIRLATLIDENKLLGKAYKDFEYGGTSFEKVYVITKTENFSYADPVDNTVTKHQGIRIMFECQSRIIIRLSGTSSSNATVRLYIDSYIGDREKVLLPTEPTLKSLFEIALELTQVEHYTGRREPTIVA